MTENSLNVSRSFRDKWEKNPDLVFRETNDPESDFFSWILRRNGFADIDGLIRFLSEKKRILDAGCGNGRATALLHTYSPPTTEFVGIDLVSADVARANLDSLSNISIKKMDLSHDLSELGTFDFIYCQEVLHHTPDPRICFHNLCNLLEEKGEIAIYVYKQKGPVREFVDDYIRAEIAALPYDEALRVCDQITTLGRTLSDLHLTIDVPSVDILGIKKGQYDLQRFIYHFFMKCYWNPSLPFNANSVINYDWYHPQLCSRHTLEEITRWFIEEKLTIVHEFVDFYGITVRGIR